MRARVQDQFLPAAVKPDDQGQVPGREPAYGQRNVSGELDHLVPLELGGSNDMKNFWVEAGKIPNPKDKVENQLHAMVCAGRISLHNAQLDIAHNWTTAP